MEATQIQQDNNQFKKLQPIVGAENLRMNHYDNSKRITIPKELLSKIYIKRIGSLSKFNLNLIDSDTVRDYIDIDFVEGGNPARYDYIPQNDFWVESTLKLNDITATFIHEITEYLLMRFKGQSYDSAHDNASKVEKIFRDQVIENKVNVKNSNDIIFHVKNYIKAFLEKFFSGNLVQHIS